MLYEHLPDWILSSEAYKGLVKSPVVGFIPLWNHALALLVEITAFVAARRIQKIRQREIPSSTPQVPRLTPVRNDHGTAAFVVLLGCHSLAFLLGLAVADMFHTFYYMSAAWAFVPLAIGATVLIAGRRASVPPWARKP